MRHLFFFFLRVAPQQKFAAIFECDERQLVEAPFIRDLAQFGFDVPLLQCRNADVFDVLLELEERSVENVLQIGRASCRERV